MKAVAKEQRGRLEAVRSISTDEDNGAIEGGDSLYANEDMPQTNTRAHVMAAFAPQQQRDNELSLEESGNAEQDEIALPGGGGTTMGMRRVTECDAKADEEDEEENVPAPPQPPVQSEYAHATPWGPTVGGMDDED